MASPEEREEVTRQAREGRASLDAQVADVHQRVGEKQHAVEEAIHRVAEKLPDPEQVHRRAEQLSERGDVHLCRAERKRAALSDDGEGSA